MLKLFAVYDSKAEAYLSPLSFQSRGQAIRAFSDEAQNPQSMFCKHPADYTLHEIAEYDEIKGQIVPFVNKVSLGSALELKAAVANSLSAVQ